MTTPAFEAISSLMTMALPFWLSAPLTLMVVSKASARIKVFVFIVNS